MNTPVEHCWLSPKILEWRSGSWSSSSLDTAQLHRAYEIWAHAERVLLDNDDEHHRTDAITTLNRAVDHRVRLLDEVYNLHSIPIAELPSRSVNILEYFGLIRPIMVRRLTDIRNAVEHEDARPPSRAVCNSFVELVWYFLRSTDPAVRQAIDSFDLNSPETDASGKHMYWIDIETGPRFDWHFKFGCWIRPEWISHTAQDRWLSVGVEESNTREDWERRCVKDNPLGGGFAPSDLYVRGRVLGPDDHLQTIISRYFRLL